MTISKLESVISAISTDSASINQWHCVNNGWSCTVFKLLLPAEKQTNHNIRSYEKYLMRLKKE